jgi:Zn-dependent M28 family amino/carboxypeptidase
VRRVRILVLLALALLLAAGCVTPTPSPGSQKTSVLPDLSDLEEPAFDTERTRTWWESFVKNYPERWAYTPTNDAAADQLAADLEAAGYEARTFYYLPPELQGQTVPVGGPSPVDQGIRTVIGIKPGSTMPDHVVAWVAHYDSNRNTIYAAYDDGSGTAVALELARTLASYNNSKTLMPIFFDAEEMGLVASKAFVDQATKDKKYTFDLVIGHDMTGINCPGHKWPMYQMVGENFADQLTPIEEALYVDHLKLDVGHASMDAPSSDQPANCIVLLDGHDRNSDERRFKEAGVPIIRMAGGRRAVDYPAYHQVNDTVEYVYEFTGGPENYKKGLETVLRTSWWNVITFDRLPPLT